MKEAKEQNITQLEDIIEDSLKFFDDVVVREEIYLLHLKKMKLEKEVEKQKELHGKFEAKVKGRVNMFFNTAFLFFAAQFGLGYYCIYEVDWLGWDLVEPVTYTIS